MDIFESRSAAPMLIGMETKPFDDPQYLFELKLDGERCLAYLGGETVLFGRSGAQLLLKFPELLGLQKQASGRCILDGELIVTSGGKPDFEMVRERSLTKNSIKIERMSKTAPAVFVVFDILYLNGKQTTNLPLLERKDLLQKSVVEGERMGFARFIAKSGTAFFELTKKEGLEGVIAKKADSLYYMGKRTREWQKIKNQHDDDYVICGYFYSIDRKVVSLVLAQYDDAERLIYKGRVTLGAKTTDFAVIAAQPHRSAAPFSAELPAQAANAVWIEPNLVCTVRFLAYTQSGGFRQPVYKGLRLDKLPAETTEGKRRI